MMFNKLISIGIPAEDYTYVLSAIELGRMQHGSNSAFIRALVYQWAQQHDAAVRQIADAREAALPPNLRMDSTPPLYAQPMPPPQPAASEGPPVPASAYINPQPPGHPAHAASTPPPESENDDAWDDAANDARPEDDDEVQGEVVLDEDGHPVRHVMLDDNGDLFD